MSADEARDTYTGETPEDDALAGGLEAIEEGLTGRLDADNRLDSGVPEEQRASDVDFVHMSGLTRPDGESHQASETPVSRESMDPNAPLSFYEEGVADVDHTMGPPAMESGPTAGHDEIVPAPAASASVEALKEIIEDLSRGPEPVPAPAPEPESAPEPEAESSPEPTAADTDEEPLDLDALLGEIAAETEALPDTPAADSGEDPLDLDALLGEAIPEAGPALKDTAAAPEPEPAPEPESEVEPETAPPKAAPPAAESRLAEAEELLHELEAQPREPIAPPAREEGDGEPELRYEFASRPARRRSRRHRARRRRRMVRYVVYAALALVLGAGGWFAYDHYLRPAVSDPQDLLREARAAMAQGQYGAAADGFLKFASRVPEDALERPEALFEAAGALSRVEELTEAARRSRRERALQVLEDFTAAYPTHPKRARAEVMAGVLLLELNEGSAAVDRLRAALRDARDSVTPLPVLRTLARAYTKTGAYEDAESTYRQAAYLPTNLTPEVDFDELGQLHAALAELETDESARAAREEQALAAWGRAVEVPGIAPNYQDEIRTHMTGLSTRAALRNLPAAGASEATDATALPALAPAVDAREPDPTLEAMQLEQALPNLEDDLAQDQAGGETP